MNFCNAPQPMSGQWPSGGVMTCVLVHVWNNKNMRLISTVLDSIDWFQDSVCERSFWWTVSRANAQIPHRPLNKKPRPSPSPNTMGYRKEKAPKLKLLSIQWLKFCLFGVLAYGLYCHSTQLTTLKWNSLFNLYYVFFLSYCFFLTWNLKQEGSPINHQPYCKGKCYGWASDC